VTWNVRELLRANLTRLFSLRTPFELEVLVVDNGSHDNTGAMVSDEFPRVRLIRNDWDAGFAGPNNQALRMARGEVVILLNPDMLVAPGAIEAAHGALMNDPSLGVVGIKLLDHRNRPVNSVRRFPDVWSQLAVLMKIDHFFPQALGRYKFSDFDYTLTQDVPSVRGSFFAFRRELLDTIGYLDPGFHIWFEEVDYCRRVTNAGLRVRYLSEASSRDYVGRGVAQMKRLETQRIFSASMIRYFKKHHPGWQPILLALARPFALAAGAAADVWEWFTGRRLK
jgi:hypothetical protein